MALNLDGFYTPEQSFDGLSRIGDKMERRAVLQQRMDEQRVGRRAAAGKFLQDWLDPKQHLTGTNYDPQIISGFNTLLQEGAELARQGADINTMMMALGPKVDNLSQYSSTAKLINQRLKDQLSKIKPNSGYDIPKLEEVSRKMAFYNQDGTFKDIETVDPNVDYVSEAVKFYPDQVTTDAGFDEFVKNSQKFSNTKDITQYDRAGGMNRKRVKITAPNWLTPDVDEKGVTVGMVPRFQIALEDGKPLEHTFEGEGGKVTKAPVRLLDEREFKSLLSNNPGTADFIRGQVKKANPDIDLNSPQANMLARAIAYDELKRRMPGSIEDVEVNDKPSAAQIRVNLGLGSGSKGSGSGSGGEININDVYGTIDELVTQKKNEGKPYLQVNLLPADAQAVIVDFANKVTKEDLTQADLKIKKSDDGKVGIFRADDGQLISFLSKTGTNLKVQPSVKEKRKVLEEDKKEKTEQPKPKPSSGIKWK